jgi:hypothetical protein
MWVSMGMHGQRRISKVFDGASTPLFLPRSRELACG